MQRKTGVAQGVTVSTRLEDLVEADPGVLEVLEEFGIRLDPWTLIALRSTIAELAEYSAIRHPEELRAALEKRFLASEGEEP